MLSACLEITVLRIAVRLVEIPGYVTKSRAIVTEAVVQDGKDICVRTVIICKKKNDAYNIRIPFFLTFMYCCIFYFFCLLVCFLNLKLSHDCVKHSLQ